MAGVVTELHRGELWHCPAGPDAAPLQTWADGALAVDANGDLVAVGEAGALRRQYPGAVWRDHAGCLILPGFVDAHLHFPQLDLIGCYGEQLLGWLNTYTFPAEAAYADPAVARTAAGRFVTELFAHGTTMSVVFSSSHRGATEALFEEALARGMRGAIGKVGMDRHAPEAILCDPETDALDHAALIERWHGCEGRLFYALAPRFAPSCSEAMLARHGELRRRWPGIYIQTHYAENPNECEWVGELFPGDRDYLAVYERHGLTGERTILAHGLHVREDAWRRLAGSRTVLAHCPASNLFLGSGLFDLDAAETHGVRFALGTDVGGGTSFSMWRTMDEAYKVQQLRGRSWRPESLFRSATLGGAEALGMAERIGNFEPGKAADFQVLDPARSRLLGERFRRTDDPAQRLFAMIMLADDRLTRAVYVQGREVWKID